MTLFNFFLVLHILGGTLGLLTGTLNLVRKKGDKIHRLSGKLFVCGMLTAGFSSLLLAWLHPNFFLFIVGVFTIYMVATGYRYIHLKMLGKDQRPAIIDWIITGAMLISGVLFIALGLKQLLSSNNFGVVLIVFGIISLRFVSIDIKNYRGKTGTKNYWLLAHLQRMIGAYIAALTAFLVVNASNLPFQLPAVVFWLLPTAVLTPVIIYYSRKYFLA